ncbi:hypothetical protein AAFC00_005207 [Neodothiora populina]
MEDVKEDVFADSLPDESKGQIDWGDKQSFPSSGESRSLKSSNHDADEPPAYIDPDRTAQQQGSEPTEIAKLKDSENASSINGAASPFEHAGGSNPDSASSHSNGAAAPVNAHTSDKGLRVSDVSEQISIFSQESAEAAGNSHDLSATMRKRVETEEQADDDEGDAQVHADADAEAEEEEEAPEESITASREIVPPSLDPTPVQSAQASPAGSPPDSSFDQESPVKRAITSMPGVTGKGKKKLPGRRRAPHANPKVEAALRRQLHLRMNYRAVAKALKPILAELGHRSLRELESNPSAHEEASEYPVVKEDLHQCFEHRLAIIQKQKELNKQRLKDILEDELEMRKTKYENVSRNIKEQHVIRLQHDFLTAVRHHEQEKDGNASDDEDEDVVRPLRHATARGNVAGILGPEYHWRSRPAVETERLFDEMYRRHEIIRDQSSRKEGPSLADSVPFTTFDSTVRDGIAISKRLEMLVQALEEVQKEPVPEPPRPIANSEALGLQALANASAASAATETAMKDAEERARLQESEAAKTKQEEEDQIRSSLSVPKPSLSQTPDEIPQSAKASAATALSNVPTPAQTPFNETQQDHVKTESHPEQYQKQSQVSREPSQAPTRSNTSFSQVAMGPSLTETAPLVRIPGLGGPLNAPTQPVIPGLSLLPQPQPSQLPGLGISVQNSGLQQHQNYPQQPPLRESTMTHHSASRTPLDSHATPASMANTPNHPGDYHHYGSAMSDRPQDTMEKHAHVPVDTSSNNRPPKDFWSSLAHGSQDSGVSKTGYEAQKSTEQATGVGDNLSQVAPDNRVSQPYTSVYGGEVDPFGPRPAERGHQYQDGRPLDQVPEENQGRASSRAPSTASAIALEPLSQRLRSTSDSFGPLLDRNDATKPAKKRAPKTSLYGPWPRSNNYHPYQHDRRASTTAVVSQEGPPHGYIQTSSGYGPSDNRQPSYQPTHQVQGPPMYSAPPPTTGTYAPPPHYAQVPPPPYSYDQRPTTYSHSPYALAPAPTGFSSLPGPPPMSQPPPLGAYYGAPPPPQMYQAQQTPYTHAPPPPLAARPPPPSSQPTYGAQYGGQPILPAGVYGTAHGSPATSNAGPAFAQYSQRDEGRRDNYGGRGRGRGPHAEWKHYQPR